MKFSVQVTGIGEVKSLLMSGRKETVGALKEALYAEAQVVLAESKRQVPFRTGVLSASGMVHEPYAVGAKAAVEISYGGAAVDYAIEQHENLGFRHAPGRKAKYLEDPVTDASGRIASRVKVRVGNMLRKRREKADGSDLDWSE